MTTISKIPVTLTVEETETILGILQNYASQSWNSARRTKSATIRAYSETEGTKARDLDAALVRRLYKHTETK